MSKSRKSVVVSVVVVSGLVACHFGDSPGLLRAGMSQAFGGEKETPRLPDGIRGFKGMMVGTIVSKAEDSFVLKVEKITRVWRQSEAKNPESVVGKEVRVKLWRESRLAERHREVLAGLKAGDRVVVEPFHLGGEHLSVVEELRKAEEPNEATASGRREAADENKTTGTVCAVKETLVQLGVEGEIVTFRVPRRNKVAAQEVSQLNRGEVVTVTWVAEGEQKFVRDIEGRGTLVGKVTDLGETWIEITPQDGRPQRFRPRWSGGMPAEGGGPDKEMLEVIRRQKVGTTVALTWEMPEGKRVVAIKPAE